MHRIIDWLLASIFTSLYWVLSHTWRVTYEGTPAHDRTKEPRIYGHWHGDELLLVGTHGGRGMAVLSSRSRDGSRMARILSWLGYFVVRGSSTRGGAGGLKGLVDAVKRRKRDASLAVDGPHGPRFEVKLGVLKLAQVTGAPLIPGVAAAERSLVFEKSWNKCFLPLPFTRCAVLYGDPMVIPREASEEELEAMRRAFQTALVELKGLAEGKVRSVGPSVAASATQLPHN
ncbi:MAG: lysophospholipid acyltransferase family protein [Deltaproteobacteria bacterium]|nr:lysophospholipid acyltransferase family protein [Deltaproteobacteria bacterium]MBI3293270.1 lysophospholipid acyltransferase family protein [Deltaproteobacteria bacterium]